MGDTWDTVMDGMRASTGFTGDKLDALGATVTDVSGRVTEDLTTVSEVVGTLAKVTGSANSATAESLVDLARLTGSAYQSTADTVSKVYTNWQVSAADQVKVNDLLLRGYQASGVSIETLAGTLTKAGPTFRALGFSIEESTALVAGLGKAGIDATAVLGPFKKAIATLIKSGKSPSEAIGTLFDRIKNAKTDTKAGQLALETFGSKGVALAGMIRDGTLDIEAFYAAIGEGGDTVQAASDDTRDMADGFAELKNKVQAFIGPMAADFAGLSDALGNSIYLLPALAGGIGNVLGRVAGSTKLRAGAGKIGKAISAAIGATMKIGGAFIDKLVGPLIDGIGKSPLWKKAGGLAGGRFGTAFKAAGILGLGLIIADEIGQAIEMANKNRDQGASNSKAMQDLLSSGITGAEAQKKLDALKQVPASLNAIQQGAMFLGGAGEGNVLGGAMDFVFGANPAEDYNEQVRALESYIASHPPTIDVKPITTVSGGGTGTAVEEAVVKPIRKAFRTASAAAVAGFGSVRDALQNPPKLRSKAWRLDHLKGQMVKVMANLRAAVKAGDPVNIRYWETARAKVAGQQQRLKGKTVATMKDIKKEYAATGVKADGTWAGIKSTTDTKAQAASQKAISEAQQTKTGIDAVNLRSSGIGLMNELASGIYAGIPQVSAASSAAAAAAAAPLAAHSPPKVGPLSKIDKWGKPLVGAWLGGIEGEVSRAGAVGARLAGAISPGALSGGMGRSGRRGAGEGGTHYHIGTLVSDNRGMDRLDRRLKGRNRMKRRDRRAPASPNGQVR
jgi:TP901 family phage tail tape measure protein